MKSGDQQGLWYRRQFSPQHNGFTEQRVLVQLNNERNIGVANFSGVLADNTYMYGGDTSNQL